MFSHDSNGIIDIRACVALVLQATPPFSYTKYIFWIPKRRCDP